MADFNLPIVTSEFQNVWDYVKAVQASLAVWQDGTTDTNIPVGSKRWSDSNRRFEEWDGAAWDELLPIADDAQPYQIRVAMANECSGNAATADLADNSLALGGVLAAEFVQTTDTRLSNSRQCNNAFDNTTTARQALDAPRMPTGTMAYFYQASAPTGWTIVSGLGDRLIAVGDYNSTPAGNVAGSWQQDGYTLTSAEIPAHTHTGTVSSDGAHVHNVYTYNVGDGSADGLSYGAGPTNGERTGMVLSSGAHTHGFTTDSSGGSGGSHNHGSSWRPAAVIGIIAERTS